MGLILTVPIAAYTYKQRLDCKKLKDKISSKLDQYIAGKVSAQQLKKYYLFDEKVAFSEAKKLTKQQFLEIVDREELIDRAETAQRTLVLLKEILRWQQENPSCLCCREPFSFVFKRENLE